MGDFVRDKRERSGMTQRALAIKAGIPQPALSDIERGKTKLPNADLRRKLAAALGVAHLDLLIAAGEITDDEIAKSGVTGTVESSPEVEDLISWIRGVPWTAADLAFVRSILERTAKPR